MKAVVLYDSVFGNTQEVAEALASSLGARAQGELPRPSDQALQRIAGADLLVVGSPTRGFRPTEPMSNLLKGISSVGLKGARVAAFDTRFKADELKSATTRFVGKTGGGAAGAGRPLPQAAIGAKQLDGAVPASCGETGQR